MKPISSTVAILSALILGPIPAQADPLEIALKEQQNIQGEAVRSQQRIDKLDDEARAMLDEYMTARAEVDNLQKYNTQMQKLVAAQEQRMADLRLQGQQLDETRRRLLPLMQDMLDALQRFVSADIPFLPRERALRLSNLQSMMEDPQASLAEKYRRLLEAYRIEAEYAHNIEAYGGHLALQNRRLNVDFLRIGRSALYWLSPDGQQSGHWDAIEDRWKTLPPSFNRDLQQAIRIARKQAPPELLTLPLSAEARP